MKGVARTRQCLYYLGQYRRQYDLEVARPQSGSSCTWFLVELEFGNVGFWGEGKTGVQGEKPLGANKRTNSKLYTRMESTPGFAEPRPDWWEASVLTTAASLAPHFWLKIAKFAKFSTEQVCELKFFTLERFSVNTTGHVHKMGQFKSKQINFWVLKFFLSLVPNDIYHILRNCFTRIFEKILSKYVVISVCSITYRQQTFASLEHGALS